MCTGTCINCDDVQLTSFWQKKILSKIIWHGPKVASQAEHSELHEEKGYNFRFRLLQIDNITRPKKLYEAKRPTSSLASSTLQNHILFVPRSDLKITKLTYLEYI